MNQQTKSQCEASSNKLADLIQQGADQCVKCGLCVPQCPTYHIGLNEAESPRGRITIMQGVVSSELPLTDTLHAHLDHCLNCRRCESVCPADVKYEELITATRTYIKNKKPTKGNIFLKPLHYLVKRPQYAHIAAKLLFYIQKLRLPTLTRKLFPKNSRISRLAAMLPPLSNPSPLHTYYPATTPKQGDLALFTGCIAQLVDKSALQNTITLLNALGFGVHVPKQHCCGALAWHGGDGALAWQLAQKNISIFNKLQVDAIISTASGCGLTLTEYASIAKQHSSNPQSPEITNFSNKIKEITELLSHVNWPETLKFAPLPKRVAIHSPCTLTNGLHGDAFPRQLLQRIPDIELIALASPTKCCGAAGETMIKYPEMSDKLLKLLLNDIIAKQPEVLVTSNIGCSLHIQGMLKREGVNITVTDPVTLLVTQLMTS